MKAELIDIQKIIKDKTGKRLPAFVIRLIEKIVNIKEINHIISKFYNHKGVDFMAKAIDYFDVKTTIVGLENLCDNQRYIFTSNHHLGAMEALALGKNLGKIYGQKINFVTNEILSHIPPLRSIFATVYVGANRQDRSKIEKLDEVFCSDNQIVMFPSGTVARKTNGEVKDFEWKKMFVAKARLGKRQVVPVYCSGKCSNFFLNFSNIRKKLGIKANIEMILFPSEMFKYRGKTIDIIIGKPIDYTFFTNDKSDTEWAKFVRDEVYKLQQK